MTVEANKQCTFLMSDTEFERISELAYAYTGVVLGPQKKQIISGRLLKRLRDLGIQRTEEYFPLIETEDKPEVSKFINALTTSQASFFSEQSHFDFLAEDVCPEWLQTNSKSKKIRIWSVGCFSGEEPYSIAMTLLENLNLSNWDCEILATDLEQKVIEKGQKGIYELDTIESLSVDRKKRWFSIDQSFPNVVKVKPELQDLITFKSMNLLDKWPMEDSYDLIFCRNVLKYFNESTQAMLFDRYADSLKDGGYLIIGHAESLNTGCQPFKRIGKSIYKKEKHS